MMKFLFTAVIVLIISSPIFTQEVSQDEWTEKVNTAINQDQSQPDKKTDPSTEPVLPQEETPIKKIETLSKTQSELLLENIEQDTQTEEIKFFGDYTVEEGQVIWNKVRIIGGNLFVHGTVQDQIVVVGGDVYLKPTAVINGQVVAIGGSIFKESGATIIGKVVEANLKGGLIYREVESSTGVKGQTSFEIEKKSERLKHSWIHPKTNWVIYNRNEGLLFTPFNLKWDHDNQSSFRLNLSFGYRFSHKKPAGRLTLEKSFFYNRNIILYGSVFRTSRSDDYYRLPETENSVAAFFGRQDFYDRWDETGYSLGAGLDFARLKIKTKFASVEQDSIPVADIWSLFQKDRLLRPNMELIPEQVGYFVTTIAYRTRDYRQLESGLALFITIERYKKGITAVTDIFNLISDNSNTKDRFMGMAIINWEFSEGLVLHTRAMGGTSTGQLDTYRQFGVGGLGSVSAHPYKIQLGRHFLQSNIELIFTPAFMDHDFLFKIFTEAGYAWNNNKKSFDWSTIIDDALENNISAAGVGFGFGEIDDFDIGINIARPMDGTDYWETTLRLNYNF